ncbi:MULTISPECIES: hypothetical protein [unclassified Mesorhizobium]|uniref:hypothetical protein n=1 Tax=unclassified Mesorhizobium TaxID=325217 RepID=UPI0019273ACD|nr:hypothetical protein MesoLjLa_27470 [Mesorhizobium sp. L-2-11]
MAVAQAVDLRDGLTLAPGTAGMHAAVRALVAPLREDGTLGIDAEALYAGAGDGNMAAIVPSHMLADDIVEQPARLIRRRCSP